MKTFDKAKDLEDTFHQLYFDSSAAFDEKRQNFEELFYEICCKNVKDPSFD